MRNFEFFRVVLCAAICASALTSGSLFAQENQKAADEVCGNLEKLKDQYFKENNYSKFVDYLESRVQKNELPGLCPNYYIALSRYKQLKYLEDKQQWDEYFSQGNNYRDQITANLSKVVGSTSPNDKGYIYSRLLLWQFHRDQQDAFSDQTLIDLVNSCFEYSKQAGDIAPIKNVADALLSYSEKAKARQIYAIYVEKLTTSNKTADELKEAAYGFYKNNNLELAELLYDAYIEKIKSSASKQELIDKLFDLAKLFVYHPNGPRDMAYAEKIYKQIEDLGGMEAFNEERLYTRAFNLEKMRDYKKAADIYQAFLGRFPDSALAPKVNYKLGIIYTYALKDYKSGMGYFTKVSQPAAGTNPSPYFVSSLYQLGLLSQWLQDIASAKNYYDKLIELAKDNFGDTVGSAKNRLNEIGSGAGLEYNLKTFMDISLKPEFSNIQDMAKLDLSASNYLPKSQEAVDFSSNAYVQESGCTQVILQYLWSGDTGKSSPSLESPNFNTSYSSPGTSVVNLVMVSPTGVVDRNFEIIDVE